MRAFGGELSLKKMHKRLSVSFCTLHSADFLLEIDEKRTALPIRRASAATVTHDYEYYKIIIVSNRCSIFGECIASYNYF